MCKFGIPLKVPHGRVVRDNGLFGELRAYDRLQPPCDVLDILSLDTIDVSDGAFCVLPEGLARHQHSWLLIVVAHPWSP